VEGQRRDGAGGSSAAVVAPQLGFDTHSRVLDWLHGYWLSSIECVLEVGAGAEAGAGAGRKRESGRERESGAGMDVRAGAGELGLGADLPGMEMEPPGGGCKITW
jgi:hypothetical protein